MVVNRIRPISCGKVMGGVYCLFGLIIGGVFSLLSLIGTAFASEAQGSFAGLFGVGAIILFPLFYGVIGFIGGIIAAALYNLIAGLFGGIEIDVQ